ncbi:hypothetical protein [Vulcaniibacterium gelatinicum]|uniref:hypothetical protein n=1 Tax=Vulcaniibacterium gelatinicum TaxID=2598725 RepID=UPI0015F2AFF9|nr:hypothetical protein [Vulcaniibacterium gelatinicum]
MQGLLVALENAGRDRSASVDSLVNGINGIEDAELVKRLLLAGDAEELARLLGARAAMAWFVATPDGDEDQPSPGREDDAPGEDESE